MATFIFRNCLNGIFHEIPDNLLHLMGKGTLQESLKWIEDFTAGGGNIRRTIEDMLHSLKRQLLLKNGVLSQELDLGYTNQEIVLLMKNLHEAYGNLRISPIESLTLEIAIVEFYNQRSKK